MLRIIFILLIAGIFTAEAAEKDSTILRKIDPAYDGEYFIRLKNGDFISGRFIEFVNDKKYGEGVRMATEVGRAIIYASQIDEIVRKEDHFRHKHRVFLLPTAEPIGDDHFIGAFELLFLYGGFGIQDWLSVTAGRSIVPGIASYEQLSELNVKFTLTSMEFKDIARKLSLAVGGNLSFLNDDNRMGHLYGVATVELSRTFLTASVFAKIDGEDFFIIRIRNEAQPVIYENGSIGIGLGIDTKIPAWHGVHFIGEIWNSNITKPTNSGVLLGLRLCNYRYSMEFGLSFFTQPLVVPFTSFSWTPF